MKSYLTNISHSVGKEMAGSSHTLICCLSKLGSSLEAGTKQPEVWLQYVYSVAKMLLYSSFDVPLALLWRSFGNTEDARYVHGGSWTSQEAKPSGTEVYASGDVCGMTHSVGFVTSCTYIYGAMSLCLYFETII